MGVLIYSFYKVEINTLKINGIRIRAWSILKAIKVTNKNNNKANIKHWYEWVHRGVGYSRWGKSLSSIPENQQVLSKGDKTGNRSPSMYGYESYNHKN